MIAAVLVGEFILVLGTTAAQEVLVGGLNWYTSSAWELIVGGVGSFLAAVLAGAAAFALVKQSTVLPIILLSLLVILETIWLFQTGLAGDPVWFDLAGSASLILGFWAGRWLLSWILQRKAVSL